MCCNCRKTGPIHFFCYLSLFLFHFLSTRTSHSAPYLKHTMKIVCIFSLFFLFSVSAQAQNTKGDKPVSNQRQVRESKGKAKTQRGNKRAKTKDIAGRRLRVKDKSSANRANVGIRQPDPYQGRKQSQSDRAAKPRGRIFTEA